VGSFNEQNFGILLYCIARAVIYSELLYTDMVKNEQTTLF